MRKRILFLSFLFLLALVFQTVFSAQEEAEIYLFSIPGCPYCSRAESFLESLRAKHPEIGFTVFKDSERSDIGILKDFYREYGVPVGERGFFPVIFAGEKYFLGFNEEIGRDIENLFLSEPAEKKEKPKPLLFLALTIGILDGFNVCSIGALVLILTIALSLRSRKKILVFGGIFILTTAVVYGLLIIGWYKIFYLLAPYRRLMEILIGVAAAAGGIYFFKQYLKFRKHGPVCEIGPGSGLIARLSAALQSSFGKPGGFLALAGAVVLFAAVVTVVEFPCSAAFPVVFTGILAQHQLPFLSSLFYIAVYFFFYFLDELLVFLAVVLTMKLWVVSGRLTKLAALFGAVILFFLGFYYLFGPVLQSLSLFR